MNAKEALHDLVERLSDDDAAEVYVFVQEFVARNQAQAVQRIRPHGLVMSGRDFFRAESRDAETLAREQGVGPIEDFDALRGDFWPEDESADEFVETIRAWRREGGGG